MTFRTSVKKTICWLLTAGYFATTALPVCADGMPRSNAPASTVPAATSVVSRAAKPKPAAAQPAAKQFTPAVTSAKLNLHGPRDYDTFLQRMMISQPVADAYASGNFFTGDITAFLQNAPSDVKKQFTDLWVGAGIPLEDITRLFDGNYANGEGTALSAKEFTGKSGEFYMWLIQVARGDSKVYVDNGLTVRDTHGELEFKVFQSITNQEGHKKVLSGLNLVYNWTIEHGRIGAEQKYKQEITDKISMLQGSIVSFTGIDGIENISETGHIIVPPGKYKFNLKLPVNASDINMHIYEAQHPIMAAPLASFNGDSIDGIILEAGTKDVTVRKSNFWDSIIPFFRCTSLRNEKYSAPKNYILEWTADGVQGSAVITVVPPEYMERFGDKAAVTILTGYLLGKGNIIEKAAGSVAPFSGHGSSGGDGAGPVIR